MQVRLRSSDVAHLWCHSTTYHSIPCISQPFLFDTVNSESQSLSWHSLWVATFSTYISLPDFAHHFSMPLEKNGHPWVLAEFPDEIEEDDAIFRIRFTGEVRSVGTNMNLFLLCCSSSWYPVGVCAKLTCYSAIVYKRVTGWIRNFDCCANLSLVYPVVTSCNQL